MTDHTARIAELERKAAEWLPVRGPHGASAEYWTWDEDGINTPITFPAGRLADFAWGRMCEAMGDVDVLSSPSGVTVVLASLGHFESNTGNVLLDRLEVFVEVMEHANR